VIFQGHAGSKLLWLALTDSVEIRRRAVEIPPNSRRSWLCRQLLAIMSSVIVASV
jgi:hypothetical protein